MDTSHGKAEERRCLGEDCCRGLIEESTVGFYRTTTDGRIVLANPAMREILGQSTLEDITRRELEADPRLSGTTRRDFRERLEREGKVTQLKCEWIRPDGSTIFVSESARVVRDENGTPLYYDGLVEDLTELRRAEAELFDSKQMMRIVLDNIPQGVFWKDREGRYRGGNAALLRTVGLASGEGIGKTDFEMPWSASAPSIAKVDAWVMETEIPKLDYEDPLILADGSVRWMRKNKLPLRDRQGNVVGVLGTSEDITARRQSEINAHLRENLLDGFFKSSPLGMFLIDRELRFLRVNEVVAAGNGLAIERHLGKTIGQILPHLAPFIEPICNRVFSTGQAILNVEVSGPAREAAQGVSHYLISLFPVGDEDGEPLAVGGVVKDITHQKKKEERLRVTQFSIDQATDAIFWSGPDARFTYVNDAACRLLGYAREELEGMAVYDVNCDITEMEWPKHRDWVMEHSPARIECRVLTKDGRIVLVEMSVSYLHYRGQEYWIAFMRDMTERHDVEEQLLLTQFAVDHAIDGALWARLDGRFCYVNEAACRILGYSRQELESMAIYDINCDITETLWPGYRDNLKASSPFTHEARVLAKHGRIIPVEMDVSYINYKGREYFIGFMHDKTERKQIEENLRLTQFAVDHAADSIFRTNPAGRFCYVNEAACRSLGYSRQELESMSVPDVSCDFNTAKWPALWARLKEKGAVTFEARDRTKDGRILPVEVTANYFTYDGKEHNVTFVRDMSEHKRAEEKLHGSRDQLRALAARLQDVREDHRKECAREIHDQLGQALTAIKLDVCSLAREWPDGLVKPVPRFESILNLVGEMIANVRRIATDLRPGILDDLGLAAAIAWSAEQFQTRTGTACHVQAPDGATPSDPHATIALFRIFQEILTNVARHAGATRVDVRLAEEDDGLVLEVHDNGRGIDPQQITGSKSLGILGMRERVLSVGGELTIRRGPENGTTVAVWVPDTWQDPEEVKL